MFAGDRRFRLSVSLIALAAILCGAPFAHAASKQAEPAHHSATAAKAGHDKKATHEKAKPSKAASSANSKATEKATDKAAKSSGKPASAKTTAKSKTESAKTTAKNKADKSAEKSVAVPRPRPHTASTPTPASRPSAAPRAVATTRAAPAAAPLALQPGALVSTERTAALPAQTFVPAPAPSTPLAYAPSQSTSRADLSAVAEAIRAARRGRPGEATEIQRSISDPLARKVVEWQILRSSDNQADFSRYAAFVTENPGWPSVGMLRRRAENMMWTERTDPATVKAFFARTEPLGTRGKLALARALYLTGDRAQAERLVRETWRTDGFGRDLEGDVLDIFAGMVTRADDKARMDRQLYEDGDYDVAMRAAQRLGGAAPAIARARHAVMTRAGNAKGLIDQAAASAPDDVGVLFSRIQWLRRNDHYAEAARLLMSAPKKLTDGHDPDDWWIERRLVARKLIELGDPRAAYVVCRDATPPEKENYKVEHEFMAGWIALRFLNDPATASRHFARIEATGVANPISLSRAGYWLGRAAEAAGRTREARAHYEKAAHWGTAYYGQLAKARLGLGEVALMPPPSLGGERRAAVSRLEVVRAVDVLYGAGASDLVIPFVADLADRTTDIAALTAIADICARNDDARAVLLVGKTALGNGLRLDYAAFPTIGLPRFSMIGPQVEPAVVYAIARQESAFNPKTVSPANALGLMQVTPAAGRFIAKKYGVRFDEKRLLSDEVYNVQMGAAELGGNIEAYNGSYVLAFAAYNAGRGRVREWIERFGDPRDPRVDAIDWVEKIPFSETRNYVQRIMENVQAYRVRFGHGTRLTIEADLRRGATD
ncbi:Soluble lytic murein transglycosylase precursor [Rhodovulum sp. PH10]|uniref:transglycosylase SLT domain-containing protein n=1 Tax=Rhodovulum sp. PH10 TaxID=1187851 RepID=UPI00027C27DB|nr:lytic transglycosylase domain-containing protein [Rhodovulum sp. PH10]EJW11283.1 Soluble lytic murein transglycosylase precursor [Rhodovulum sp. PH10]